MISQPLEEVTTNSGSGGIFCEERRRRRNLFIDRKAEGSRQIIEANLALRRAKTRVEATNTIS